MREASLLLGVWEGTLRKRLQAGEIRGEKTSGPNGPEWRIWLPEEAAPAPSRPVVDLEALTGLFDRSEAAAFRIGYLEAQLAAVPQLTEGLAAAAAREEAARERERQACAEQARLRWGCRVGWALAGLLALLLLLALSLPWHRHGRQRESGRAPVPAAGAEVPMKTRLGVGVEAAGAAPQAPGVPPPDPPLGSGLGLQRPEAKR
jgi:hypothetical protein